MKKIKLFMVFFAVYIAFCFQIISYSYSKEPKDTFLKKINKSEISKKGMNRFVNDFMKSEGYVDAKVISSNVEEVEGYLLKAKGKDEIYTYVVEIKNPRNNLIYICSLDKEKEIECNQKYNCFTMSENPGTKEMLEALKNTFVNRYYNNFALLRRKSGGLTDEEKQNVEKYKRKLDAREWVFEPIKMYHFKIEIEDKNKDSLGCDLVGGNSLFLDTGRLVYSEKLEICKDFGK